MIFKISLPHLHVSATSPYPEPDQSSPSLPIPIHEDPSRLCLGLPLMFPYRKPLCTSSSRTPSHTCHMPSLSPEHVIHIYHFSTVTMVTRTRHVISVRKLLVFSSANPHKTKQHNICTYRFILYRYMLLPKKGVMKDKMYKV